MANYYNTTRGPISVSLSSGKEMSIPPKSWIEIDRADEGSASLVSMVSKGFLVRSAVADAPAAPAPAPVPAPAPAPAEEKAAPPVASKKAESKSASVEK